MELSTTGPGQPAPLEPTTRSMDLPEAIRALTEGKLRSALPALADLGSDGRHRWWRALADRLVAERDDPDAPVPPVSGLYAVPVTPLVTWGPGGPAMTPHAGVANVSLEGEHPPPLKDNALTLLSEGLYSRSIIAHRHLQGTGGGPLLVEFLLNMVDVAPEKLRLRVSVGDDHVDVLRFRPSSVVVDGGYSVEIPSAGTHHYAMVLGPQHLDLYVDGLLLAARERRTPGAMPDGVSLQLLGAPSGRQQAEVADWQVGRLPDGMTGPLHAEDPGLAATRITTHDDEHEDQAFEPKKTFRRLFAVGRVPFSLPESYIDRALEAQRGTATWEPWLWEELQRRSTRDLSGVLDPLRPEPVVEVEALRVVYSRDPSRDLSLARILRREERDRFDVLSDLDFTVYPGDIVGIIGRNGAGKSTLLRTLTGAVQIESGRIRVVGNGVLLRPGVGMREHLTGRQNIINSGIYMGLDLRAIDEVMQDVIEFSELGEAIERPYKYYSDGMRSRLIFALATSISPEILMLDELLGAGDTGFQEKAMNRLDNFLEKSRVVLVVQHGTDFLRTRCNKALYLKHGRQVFFGDAELAAELYQSELES